LAQDGTPVHPLYLPFTLRPQPYNVTGFATPD
jgi:hypothetical protein